MSRRLLQIRSPGIAAWLRAIAFLLAVALLGSIPSAASAQPSPCANGIAVPDPANNPGLVADCDSLLSARDTLAGTATLDWSADLAIGNWEGVTVSGTPPRVITLDLPFRQLKGTIPDDLGSLTNLTDLSLGYNELSGEIPAELSNLTNLETLHLHYNQLSGEIPAELGGLTNLTDLSLGHNELSGEIPVEMGSLTNLLRLRLWGNQLSGEIPAELGGLTNLRGLGLNDNQLSGEIPVEMGSLTNLLRLRLWGNQLSGEIPSELGSLTNLDQLYLYSNQLSGEIPAELGSLTNLTSLGLSANQLSGEIPAELDGLTNLTDLSLNANQLSGEIPSELGSLTNLTELHLHYNQLSGEIPSELGSLTNLTRLGLSVNQLSGEIPAELGSLANLTGLDLSGNQLSGEIPAELGSLANLTRLYLSNNQLSGCIPSALRYVPSNDFAELGLLFCAAAPAPMMDVCIEALGDLANTELTGSWVDGCESEERNGSYARFYTFTLGQDSEVTLTLQSDDANTYLYLRQGNATSGTALHENDGHEGSRSVSQIQVTLSAGTYTIEATTYGEGETGSFALSVAGLGTAAGPTPSVPALWFDTESAPFDDPRVRYAISYAIDQELINEIFWDGRGDLQSPVPDALFPQWTTELDEPGVLQEWHLYDLGESRRLLAEAGYPDGLETRVHVLSRWAQWAEVIAEMLAEVGIVVDVVISDPALIAALGQVSHQAMILAPLQGFGGDVAAFILEHFTDEGQHNYSRLDSDVPEEILSEFVGTEDTERRRELVYNLQNHLHERWFLVPLPAPPMPPASTDPCIEPLAGLATIIGDWDEDACASGVPGRGYARYFSFTVAQASEVTITLESEVDTYLYLRTGQDRSGEPLHENDDLASGNTNSRIQETLEAGAYTIEATTYKAGSTGSFTLTVSGLGGTNAPLPSPRPHAGDRAALVALYDATGGSNWVRSGGWGSDAPIDEWHGVSADGGGRVVGLNLPRNGLAGEIPQQLGSLARLRFLNLIGNQLSGEIPEELGNLTSLEQLGLGDNQLRGEIPSELGNLANLTELSLGGNELKGKIPSELGNLAGLTSLGLWSNQLSGEIPDELGNLLNLKSLALSFNRLSGEIPADLGSLTNLRRLQLGSNQLTGKIPPELGSLLNLESLGLRNNELTGKIPPELANLTSLEELGLSDNHLSGEIPPELGNLTSLGNILFGRNQLTGEIPPELGDLLNLHSLYLYENELTGEIPPELGNLTNLTILRLDGNQLTGEIPVELSNLPNLIHLYLFDNELTGGILPELGNLTYLKTLLLYGNQFTGEIPSELGRLSNLDRLDLGGNQLSGEIPSGLGSLSNLTVLWLSGNQLSEEIPSELGNLSELGRLHLEDNQLTGSIPSSLGNLSNLEWLYLAGNQLTGCIPIGIQGVANNDLDQLGFPSCGGLPGAPAIVFGGQNWTSALLQTEIARHMVEHGYGYATEKVFGGVLPLLQGLRDGDIHLLMEGWLPNQIEYWEAALSAGDILDLGTSLGNVWQSAFVIPAYLQEQYPGLDHVEDLKQQQYRSLFSTAETKGKARLVSCVPGWSCELVNDAQIEGYGLTDYLHVIKPGDQDAMFSEIYGAYERGEPWLGYMWGTGAPALLLDLVRLEEPAYSDECWSSDRACAYEDDTILIGAHSSLPALAPDVVDFLEQWDFGVDVHLRYATRWMDANPEASIEEAALNWLTNHVDTWSDWVTEGAAAGILATLPEVPTPAEHSATRSFSATTVAPGAEVTVNIALSEYGRGGSVTETLPEGFTFVPGSVEWTGGGGFVRPSGNLVWVVLAGAGVTNVIYKVTAPSEAGGPFEFTGKFVNFDGESVDIGGASTVTVAADAGTPASYDSNGNGIIELSELFVAIDDYFASEISLAVLFDIIDFYFSGERVG